MLLDGRSLARGQAGKTACHRHCFHTAPLLAKQLRNTPKQLQKVHYAFLALPEQATVPKITTLSNARPHRHPQVRRKTTEAVWQGGKASELQQLLMWLRIQLQKR